MGEFTKKGLGPATKQVLTDPQIGHAMKRIFNAVVTDHERGYIPAEKLPLEVFRVNAIVAVYLLLAPGVSGARGLARMAGADAAEEAQLHLKMKRLLREAFDEVWVVAARLEENDNGYIN